MKIVQKMLFGAIVGLFVKNMALCGIDASKPVNEQHPQRTETNTQQQPQILVNAILHSIENMDYHIISLSAVLKSGVVTFQGSLESLFQQIKKNVPKNKTTFVIFSEMFFSSTPLETKHVKPIIEECKKLTSQNQRLFVCVNFLHKFSERPSWLPEEGINSRNKSIKYINTLANPLDSNELVSIFWPEKTNSYKISNYSLIIWNGKPISFYRKSTYCKEADSECIANNNGKWSAGDSTYEFGDWQIHSLCSEDPYQNIFTRLFHSGLISLRICFDVSDTIDDSPLCSKNNAVCFIQANGVPQIAHNFSLSGIQKETCRFVGSAPDKCCFIVSDSHTGKNFGNYMVLRLPDEDDGKNIKHPIKSFSLPYNDENDFISVFDRKKLK